MAKTAERVDMAMRVHAAVLRGRTDIPVANARVLRDLAESAMAEGNGKLAAGFLEQASNAFMAAVRKLDVDGDFRGVSDPLEMLGKALEIHRDGKHMPFDYKVSFAAQAVTNSDISKGLYHLEGRGEALPVQVSQAQSFVSEYKLPV
jgi:hypothetical protein